MLRARLGLESHGALAVRPSDASQALPWGLGAQAPPPPPRALCLEFGLRSGAPPARPRGAVPPLCSVLRVCHHLALPGVPLLDCELPENRRFCSLLFPVASSWGAGNGDDGGGDLTRNRNVFTSTRVLFGCLGPFSSVFKTFLIDRYFHIAGSLNF